MPLARWISLALLLTLSTLTGCPQQESVAAPATDQAPPTGAIKIKNGDAKVAFRIKPKESGYRVSDEAKTELYRVKLGGTKAKVKDPKDAIVAYVNTDGTKFKIKDANDKEVLFVFRLQEDGDYKLETGKDALVCKLKKRDYGWEGKNAEGTEIFKSKTKQGKTSVKDAKERTLYSTKDPVKDLAFACLALPDLTDAQRIGLMLLVETTVK